MCDNCGCFCEEDCAEEEVEISKEELIDLIIEEIGEGACVGCALGDLFDFAYNQGKRDLAEESRDFYQDVLDEKNRN